MDNFMQDTTLCENISKPVYSLIIQSVNDLPACVRLLKYSKLIRTQFTRLQQQKQNMSYYHKKQYGLF